MGSVLILTLHLINLFRLIFDTWSFRLLSLSIPNDWRTNDKVKIRYRLDNRIYINYWIWEISLIVHQRKINSKPMPFHPSHSSFPSHYNPTFPSFRYVLLFSAYQKHNIELAETLCTSACFTKQTCDVLLTISNHHKIPE